MNSRIIISKANHNGRELDCYVPQIFVNGNWQNCISDSSYILKETFNPLMVCKCNGGGCAECNGRGFRKGISEDNKYIAEFFIERAINLD